ncbi:MAG: TolC family outer membrane protein [Rhodobacterales bacterium]|nr:TolC family outer membrane protein [Rhodobacterales bacterium]
MRAWLQAVTVVLAGVLAGSAAAPMAGAQSLTDALIAAYRNSNLLEQNRAVLRAADEDVAVAVSSLRPVVAYTAQAGWSKADLATAFGRTTVEGLSASLTLSAELTLLDFGRSVLATRQALIAVEQQVLLAAVQAFADVRVAQEVVLLRQNNLRLITEELRAAEARFEVGENTRTDVAIAESRLAGSNAQLAVAEGTLLVAREAYKAATGGYPGTLRELPTLPALPRTLEEAQEVARNTNPSIRQAQQLVTVSDLQVALAEAARLPTVGAGVTLRRDDLGLDTQSIGLTMNQTLYAGGRISALQRQAIAGKDAARAALQQTAVLVMQNVGVAWANLNVSFASIEATDQQINAAQTAFDGVRQEAEVGARTTLDVLDAEQELLDAKNARLEAVAQRYVGVYLVLASMGLLTVNHLQLGIPTYDPEAYFNAVKNAPAHSVQGAKLDRILKKIGN